MAAYPASDIAKYFVKKSYEKKFDDGSVDGVTNLKLQKLVYFAQAAKLVKDKEPLFTERIEAWKYGPVLPTLYKELRQYGNNIVPEAYANDMSEISPEDMQILDEIWEKLSEASATRLVDITHKHEPWKEAYARGANTEISHESLISFYKDLFSVDEQED